MIVDYLRVLMEWICELVNCVESGLFVFIDDGYVLKFLVLVNLCEWIYEIVE